MDGCAHGGEVARGNDVNKRRGTRVRNITASVLHASHAWRAPGAVEREGQAVGDPNLIDAGNSRNLANHIPEEGVLSLRVKFLIRRCELGDVETEAVGLRRLEAKIDIENVEDCARSRPAPTTSTQASATSGMHQGDAETSCLRPSLAFCPESFKGLLYVPEEIFQAGRESEQYADNHCHQERPEQHEPVDMQTAKEWQRERALVRKPSRGRVSDAETEGCTNDGEDGTFE